MNIWDLFLPQINMQVNLLRQSNVTPKISAWAQIHGQHNFNRHPLAPLGIEAHVYIPPNKRKTWAVKSHKGFYIGTSTEHYRYFKAYCTKTRAIQGSKTMYFKHKYIMDLVVTPADAVVQAAKQLADVLKGVNPPPMAASSIEQIETLSKIFTEQAKTDKKASSIDEHKANAAHSPRVDQSTDAAPPPRVDAKPKKTL